MGQVESLRTENKFKKTEIGEIPVDWEVVNLGEVTQLIMGQSPPFESYFEFVNGIPFFQGNSEFGTKFPKILKWCNSPRKLAEKGDILVSVQAPVGDINIAPVECCIGRGLAALRGTKIYNDYLYFVMNYFKDTLVKIGQGSTFEAINKKDLFKLKIPFPIISEQKKIAEILTSMDEAIEKKQEIIEKTKMLKKGLMQELLTCGIGHKKFKKTEIGEIPVDWDVLKVQDVCEKPEYGYTVSTTEKPIGPKFLRISDIQDGKVNWEKVPFCHCPNSIKEKYILKPGDILFARTGATTEKSYIIKKCPEAIFASYLIRVVTKGRINSNFLYLVFNSFIYWRQIKEQIGGSAQGGVNASSLSSIKIPLPPLSEQIKIAEILTSVDEEIENEMAHKERLEGTKKGLMQVLLTGKIRAKI